MGAIIHTRQDWENAQWQQRARDWIREQVDQAGLGAVHSIEQTHLRAWSTVMRVRTNVGPLWFKANADSSRHEAALLTAMSGWLGDSVPALVATDTTTGWFLTRDAGVSLAQILEGDGNLRHWEDALAAYGAVQRRLERHAQSMLNLGVPDCRPKAMPALLHDLLADTRSCRLGEPNGLTPEAHGKLADFLPEFTAMCETLDGFGIAPTLQHDDLHRSNVFLANGRHVFLDWADAGVAHPFGSLIYPMLQAAELPCSSDPQQLARLKDAYLEPWTDVADRPALRAAAQLSVKVASVGRAMIWRRAAAASEWMALKEYYATGVPRWLRTLLPE